MAIQKILDLVHALTPEQLRALRNRFLRGRAAKPVQARLLNLVRAATHKLDYAELAQALDLASVANVRQVATRTGRDIEAQLVQDELARQPARQALLLLDALRGQGRHELAQNIWQEAFKAHQETPASVDKLHLTYQFLEWQRHLEVLGQNKDDRPVTVHDLARQFDLYAALARVRLICADPTAVKTLTPADEHRLRTLLADNQSLSEADHHLAQAYLAAYDLLIRQRPEAALTLWHHIQTSQPHLQPAEHFNLYRLYLNFLIKRQGQPDWHPQVLAAYEWGFAHGMHQRDGFIIAQDLENFLALLIQAQQWTTAHTLLTQYLDRLPPAEQANHTRFCWGYLHFRQDDFQAAHRRLSQKIDHHRYWEAKLFGEKSEWGSYLWPIESDPSWRIEPRQRLLDRLDYLHAQVSASGKDADDPRLPPHFVQQVADFRALVRSCDRPTALCALRDKLADRPQPVPETDWIIRMSDRLLDEYDQSRRD